MTEKYPPIPTSLFLNKILQTTRIFKKKNHFFEKLTSGLEFNLLINNLKRSLYMAINRLGGDHLMLGLFLKFEEDLHISQEWLTLAIDHLIRYGL